MASSYDEAIAAAERGEEPQAAEEPEPIDHSGAVAPEDDLETLKALAGLGTIVGGIAHKMNNPMMGVVNHVKYAQMKISSDPAKAEEALETALKYTRRCVEIVEELLPFARPGIAGLLPPGISADIDKTVARSIIASKDPLQTLEVSVDTSIATDLPEVGLQQSLLEQVIIEVIANACKAMEGREHRILDISAVQAPHFVTLQITDTGCGMDQEVLDHAFDPLFSFGESAGSGIGLSMAKSIVESIGGTIGLKSESNQGTAVTLALPIFQAMKH